MAKDLRELVRDELTDYEKAERIVALPFYVGGLEAQDLCRKYNSKDLNDMYIIGQIMKKYQRLLDY